MKNLENNMFSRFFAFFNILLSDNFNQGSTKVQPRFNQGSPPVFEHTLSREITSELSQRKMLALFMDEKGGNFGRIAEFIEEQ